MSTVLASQPTITVFLEFDKQLELFMLIPTNYIF